MDLSLFGFVFFFFGPSLDHNFAMENDDREHERGRKTVLLHIIRKGPTLRREYIESNSELKKLMSIMV